MTFTIHERTEDEKKDIFLAWQRPDDAFFASGACHILAHQFLSLHDGEGYQLIRIKPQHNLPGNHYYASNGEWMFDFSGWNKEAEYLAAMTEAYKQHYLNWAYDRILLAEGLVAHIASDDHNLRPPEYFPELPWKRAHEYIQKFPKNPPRLSNRA